MPALLDSLLQDTRYAIRQLWRALRRGAGGHADPARHAADLDPSEALRALLTENGALNGEAEW